MTHPTANYSCHSLRRALLALAWLLPALAAGLSAASAEGEQSSLLFEVGLTRSAISNVNANDAMAAYSVFLNSVSRNLGYHVKSEVTIYENTPSLKSAIRQGKLNLISMDTWQYLENEADPHIRPYFLPTIGGQLGRRYLVLVRKESGIHALADLRGRSVLCLESVRNQVCFAWLETVVPDDPPGRAAAFIASLESAAKPTAAVLPVFFGQKDACVVDERSFDLMKELNPQVGKVIAAIAISPRFVDFIICLGEQPWAAPAQAKADTIRTMTNLTADPAGRQVLNLFRASGLVVFKEESIATVRALWHARRQMPSAVLAADQRP